MCSLPAQFLQVTTKDCPVTYPMPLKPQAIAIVLKVSLLEGQRCLETKQNNKTQKNQM